MNVERSKENPILSPDGNRDWESVATFNPSVASDGRVTHIVYRAVSPAQKIGDDTLELSTIGHAVSNDGATFTDREQLIKPEHNWEKFGCEDPRITKFGDRYFIFYTALSRYPFSADGIKIGVAVTKDFKTLEKHPVTPFNSKAMALFPELIDGKMAAILTVHTDSPPSKICLALFDKEEDIWSEEYWAQWHADLASHIIPIPRGDRDHIELGTPPIKTEQGWLFLYAYIDNYFSPPATFGVQAMLVDAKDPRKIIGAAKRPFFLPDEPYERQGRIANIVFCSGALIKGDKLEMYYGGADTVSGMAELATKELVDELISVQATQLQRFDGNPTISPIAEHQWESKATFNPTAVYDGNNVHIIYRAMGGDNTSVFGYATSDDGLHIKERLSDPIYTPRADFEKKLSAGANSGCEDARITKLGNRFYVCYTAYDSKDSPRVAFSSISAEDFLNKKWNWSMPTLISKPNADDKDAALFPEQIEGKYVFLHRLGVDIWIDRVDDLAFTAGRFLGGKVLMKPQDTSWDSKKIGIAGAPIKTEKGWLLLYHGISRRTNHYNLRAALLDLKDPSVVLGRTRDSILDPTEGYEKEGIVPHVVFSCGAVVIKDTLFVYYGGADKVAGVATVLLQNILDNIDY